jgi:hypothetical protein
MWRSWVRLAWHLGGALKPWEYEALTLRDKRDLLDALDWKIEQENEALEKAMKK